MSQQINLFNPIFLKQKKIFTALPMVKALGVLLLGVLAVAFYGKQRVAALQQEASVAATILTQKQARQAGVNAQFLPRRKDPTLALKIAQAQAEFASLQKVSDLLKGSNSSGYSEYFKAFARQSVAGLWLTGLTITGSDNQLGVKGRALQAALVPNYIGRLTGETVMRGKSFATLKVDQPLKAHKAGVDAVRPEFEPFVEFSLQSIDAAETLGVLPK